MTTYLRFILMTEEINWTLSISQPTEFYIVTCESYFCYVMFLCYWDIIYNNTKAITEWVMISDQDHMFFFKW